MTYKIIESGSKGNMIIIDDTICLDMGVSYKKAQPYLKNLKLLFISHLWLHKDHLLPTTIKTIIYNKPNIKIIIGSKGVADILINQCEVPLKNVFLLKTKRWYDIGMCKIKLDELVHDTPNYAIHIDYKKNKILYAVDTAEISHITAKDYDLYLIEANYMEDVLERHKRELDENCEYDHLYRVQNVHLSYEQANSFLIENMGNNSIYEYVHKSSYNFEEERENA